MSELAPVMCTAPGCDKESNARVIVGEKWAAYGLPEIIRLCRPHALELVVRIEEITDKSRAAK